MGRKKIPIQLILKKRNRESTFRKRYPGLIKKAHELGVLCDQEIHLFVKDRATNRMRTYATSSKPFQPDYSQIMPNDRQGPESLANYYTSHNENTHAPQAIPDAWTPLITALMRDTRRCNQIFATINHMKKWS
jgi:hypothetical protein